MLALRFLFFCLSEGACTTRIAKGSESVHASQSACFILLIINVSQNDKSLTFLLRAPKIHLEPLSIYQISTQYETALSIPPETAVELARLTKGYAFAFQALGLLYFDKTEMQSLSDILPKLDGMLDDFVYRKIWESLSEKRARIGKGNP